MCRSKLVVHQMENSSGYEGNQVPGFIISYKQEHLKVKLKASTYGQRSAMIRSAMIPSTQCYRK